MQGFTTQVAEQEQVALREARGLMDLVAGGGVLPAGAVTAAHLKAFDSLFKAQAAVIRELQTDLRNAAHSRV